MNQIPLSQNQAEQLQRLAAQRQLYSDAKTSLVWQTLLAIPVAISLSFMAILFPATQEWVSLFGLLILFLNFIVLEPRQQALTKQAAKIQEMFDCSVLSLKWQEEKMGAPPEVESIIAHAERYWRNNPDSSNLHNWYPIAVGQVPPEAARVICQRTNIWWDSELHRRYSKIVIIALISLTALVLLLGFAMGNMTLQRFVYAIVAPLSPGFLWGYREYKKHQETADTLDHLMGQAKSLWEKVCAKNLSNDELQQASRTLQNQLYDHRRSAALVFDWIYSRLRRQSEEEMNKAADVLVTEFLNCHGKTGQPR